MSLAIPRRTFLAGSAAAGALLVAPQWARGAQNRDDLRVAVIGFNGRGRDHIAALGPYVVALCDCDERVLAREADGFAERHQRKVERFTDYRRLLERDDINAVSIATPNHTHSLIAIAAIEAGKDVYVEKPVSHNVWEGRQLAAAAAKHQRVVQCGTQSRSAPCLQQAVEFVESGKLGKIEYVVGTCYKPREPIGNRSEPLEIPKYIDYDLWCGPADKVDLYRPHLHYDWHWDFNTGAGDTGNQGIHQMDVCRWFLGEQGLPPRTIGIGARLGYDDAGNTPNTQVVLHDYAKAPILFETRGLPESKKAQSNWKNSMDRYRGSRVGVIVQCEEGHVYAPSSYADVWAYDRDGNEIEHWTGSGDHFGNWVKAVKEQNPQLLNAEVTEGHVSSALCHIGNISNRLGEKLRAGEIREVIGNNELLAESFDRMVEHLKKNEVPVDSEPLLEMGPWLEIDPAKEMFVGNDKANELRMRRGRKGFEVPVYESVV
jgi:predicted dehydrogenase